MILKGPLPVLMVSGLLGLASGILAANSSPSSSLAVRADGPPPLVIPPSELWFVQTRFQHLVKQCNQLIPCYVGRGMTVLGLRSGSVLEHRLKLLESSPRRPATNRGWYCPKAAFPATPRTVTKVVVISFKRPRRVRGMFRHGKWINYFISRVPILG